MNFNLQGALAAASDPNLCKQSSQHRCAFAVRSFLERGGLDTTGRPGLAKQYTNFLPKIGYQLIGSVNNRASQEQFTASGAQPGDIAVYIKPGHPEQPGHICLWDGRNWCSDFRQKGLNVYSADTVAYIYRYTGEIDNSPVDPLESTEGLDIPELTGESLAARCPAEVKMTGLWSRYHLKAGRKSPVVRSMKAG